MRTNVHSKCLLDLKDTHNEFWCETLNANITFLCLLKRKKLDTVPSGGILGYGHDR